MKLSEKLSLPSAWVLSALLLLAPLSGARASNPMFSPQALEKAMLDLYCQFPDQPAGVCAQVASLPANPAAAANPAAPAPSGPAAQPGLSSSDVAVWALEIFDQITLLDTDGFNDVMTHLAADYRQHPEHRLAIELVTGSVSVEHSVDVLCKTDSEQDPNCHGDDTADAVRERLREELANVRKRNTVITVMDDVLLAFTVAYTFEFGRGVISGGRSLWATGGEGMGKLEKFKAVVRMVVTSDKLAKDVVSRNKLMIFAAGLGVGLTQAAIQAWSTYKIDPRHLLEPVQGDIVSDVATRAASERDEIRAMLKDTPDQLKARAQAYRDRMNQMDKDVTSYQSQMEHLYNVAAQYRPQMEPVAQDLTEIRNKISQLGLKLDGLEIGGGLN
jgi:hypothetical protein